MACSRLANPLLPFQQPRAQHRHQSFITIHRPLKRGQTLTVYSRKPAVAPGVSVTQAVLEPMRSVALLSKPLTHAVGSAVKCIPCL